MKKEDVTYLNIPLTQEIADKLGIAFKLGKIGDEDIIDFGLDSKSEEKIILATEKLIRAEEKNEQLIKLKTEIKDILAFDLGKALIEFKNKLQLHSQTYDSVILLMAKHNRIGQSRHKGIIAFQEAELEITKIENAVMYMLNNIFDEELRK